jgi:hypothetical protein
VGDSETATAPLEYFLTSCVAPLTLTFRAFNARAPWFFVLGDGGMKRPRVLARSSPVAFRDAASPRAVRLTPAEGAGAVRVSWTSPKAAASSPRVVFRSLTGGGNTTVPADTLHLGLSNYCGGDATGMGYRDAGFFHTAVLSGLVPGARYAYSVGDDVDASNDFIFRAFPTAASGGLFPFQLLAVGDMGQDTPDGAEEQATYVATIPSGLTTYFRTSEQLVEIDAWYKRERKALGAFLAAQHRIHKDVV